ncbi:MAG: S-adenosylmethionine-diacylglycerol 3-amino-3-carboxypropyl transferase [Kiritimatiellia bacterium]|jgi:S-adenosylmethionine-diacylglycerol 3-amino-3-carboxypropyl transferase
MHQPGRDHGVRHRLHQAGFNALYRRSLIYNQCWEDPAVDRLAMNIGPDSEILVITSAGCNALDYLLQEPRSVHAVDANPLQTALLELKIAGIRTLNWHEFFQVFGEGVHPTFPVLYNSKLRPELSEPSQAYWDKNLNWWNGGRVRRSFYDHGLSGIFARMFVGWVGARPSLERALKDLFAARDMDDQRKIWDEEVVPRLFTRSLRWLMGRQLTMNLLGIPYEQHRIATETKDGGIATYARESLDKVVRFLPVKDNYFYRVYLESRYTPDCCPEYLKEANFERLKGLVDRLHPTTTMVTDYLRSGAVKPTHLVLLDHMDWMGTAFPEALAEEWTAIVDHAVPGARVLFRSGETTPEFLDNVRVHGTRLWDLLQWDQVKAAELHKLDRVGTYASFWIGDIVVQ